MTNLARRFGLSALGVVLLGYVLAGRGFAHLGLPPFHVGEAALLALAGAFIFAARLAPLGALATWPLALLCLWCLGRTLPFIDEYGLDSLRDAALYGYAAFAVLAAALLAERGMLDTAARLYGQAVIGVFAIMPLVILVQPSDFDPAINQGFIFVKSGDLAVHLAGALAFMLLGLRRDLLPPPGVLGGLLLCAFWLGAVASFLWIASNSRGGLLAVIAAMAVVVACSPERGRATTTLALFGLAIIVLGLLGVAVQAERRDVSVEQLLANLLSIFDTSPAAERDAELASTVFWRLAWWEDILDRTLFGEAFWLGDGFGVNLANLYGYQTDPDDRLRSPHNGTLTFLARAGVPGLLLWLGFLGTLAAGLVRTGRAMRRAGFTIWPRVNAWVLAFLTAALVNASFDVYLEGPQGGIWFWAVVGLGLAVMAVERELLGAGPRQDQAP